jgi:hypothetical protein
MVAVGLTRKRIIWLNTAMLRKRLNASEYQSASFGAGSRLGEFRALNAGAG